LKPGTSEYTARVLQTLPARSISLPNHEARIFSPVSTVTRTKQTPQEFPRRAPGQLNLRLPRDALPLYCCPLRRRKVAHVAMLCSDARILQKLRFLTV
jgi:hypothetical protein